MRSDAFWLADAPLVLASASSARRALLEASGIPLEVKPARIDEAAIAIPLVAAGATPRAIAGELAMAKAKAAARSAPGRIVLAADQTLDLDGEMMMKARDIASARAQIERLRGTAHQLHSAAVLRRADEILWAGTRSAALTMRDFSDAFLDRYLARMGTDVLESVGGYQLEALGIQLFATIDGDHATILGLPLMDILAALRKSGLLLD